MSFLKKIALIFNYVFVSLGIIKVSKTGLPHTQKNSGWVEILKLCFTQANLCYFKFFRKTQAGLALFFHKF